MEEVKAVVKDGVARISINRPKALNALNRAVVDKIDAFVSSLDACARVLLIYSPDNFAAGADIKDMTECNAQAAKAFAFSPTYNKIAALNIPTIAAIDGFALGGGLELALTCDIRIASDRAKMGFPEINLGIMPGAGGTIRAARCIGRSAAMEMIFTGKPVKAQEALALGLISRIVPAQELEAQAMALAESLAKKAPIALQMAKRTVLAGTQIPDEEAAIALEAENWAKLFNTADQKEGMRAFAEKRPPAFVGA